MSKDSPVLAGCDHIGFTVPDIEVATRLLVDVIGCTVKPLETSRELDHLHL